MTKINAHASVGALMSREQPAPEDNLVMKNLLWVVASLFAIFTLICLFLPKPQMPHFGLDPSWVMGMNWAISHGVKIGQDIIFTFGPYASSYTQSYDPGTDNLQVGGGAFLTLCYSVALLYLAGRHRLHIALFLVITLIAFPYSRDALLLLYPLVAALCVRKYIIFSKPGSCAGRIGALAFMALLCAPFGFLPLIKGSFLLSCTISGISVSIYMLYRRWWATAIAIGISPIIVAAVAWLAAGQVLKDLPHFFLSMMPIISGYTEAMSLDFQRAVTLKRPGVEIVVFALVSLVMLVWMVRNLRYGVVDKFFCFVVGSLFLFISFKAGFTRHDGHAMAAACGLLFFAVTLGFLIGPRVWIKCLALAFIGFLIIGYHYEKTLLSRVPANIKSIYGEGWAGATMRVDDSDPLKTEYEAKIKEMKAKQSLPLLSGNSDIYSYDQASLLASGNEWNPRPIFQSYSAYTPKLAELNASHLRGNNAPDNIFFRPQTIDGRFAATEDGASWPALLDNYDAVDLLDDLTVLRKRDVMLEASVWRNQKNGRHKFAEDIKLPRSGLPIYVKLSLDPTFLGRILAVLFKPPQLNMELKFVDGRKENYRVISGMMKSGFFISPSVQTGKYFYLLQSGNVGLLSNANVVSFQISRPVGGGIFWKTDFDVNISEYQTRAPKAIPASFLNSTFQDGLPGSFAKVEENCDGSIDVINDVTMSDAPSTGGSLFSASGWLVESAKEGTVPQKTFVALTGSDGKVWYAAPHSTPRADVKSYLGHPGMPDVGFSVAADVSKLSGQYSVGLVKIRRGEVVMCQFKKPITISQQ